MKRTLNACNTIANNISPIRTRYRDKQKEQVKHSFQNNHRTSSRSLSQQSHTSEDQDNQYHAYAYKCGCDYSTDSIHSFKNHVLDSHRGEYLKGSTHFLSGMTKVVLPYLENNNQSLQNQLNSNDYDWKTKLKEAPGEIWWNGFVLIRNRNFKREAFYCGQCQMPFVRVIDFVNHCLAECGQLWNEASSHFIYDETDWKIKVKEELLLKTKPKSIIEQYKINKQIEYTQKSKSNKIFQNAKDYEFHKQIVNFTKNYSFRSQKRKKFSFGKYYFHINDKTIFDNFSEQPTSPKGKFKCFTCNQIFQGKYEFYKHLFVNGEKQDVRSDIFVFDRELFYKANQERLTIFLNIQQIKLDNLRIDYEFLEYLVKKDTLSTEWRIYLDSVFSYLGIIKSFSYGWNNFQFDDEYFKCEGCHNVMKYHGRGHCAQRICNHIYSGNIECWSKDYAFIQLDDCNNNISRKKVMLNRKSRYLQNENFICPCQKNMILSKASFVNHVVQQHQGIIHIQFYTAPSIFE